MTSPPSVPEPPPKSHTTGEKEEAKKPKLDPLEENKARQEESLDQKITYDVIRREGDKELERPLTGLWWAAVAGGLSMGFTFLTDGLLRSHLPDAEWRPLITKLGYPVGFLCTRRGEDECVRAESTRAFNAIGLEALRHGFLTTLASGVFAGWLIALMVWMLPASLGNQVSVIAIPTYLIGIGGFAHIIVGSVETLYLVLTGAIGVSTFLTGFFIPSLIGNVIGGFVLVTWLNHAQVTSGDGHRM